jgi:4-hydroxybenzoate polyprenyltransferase
MLGLDVCMRNFTGHNIKRTLLDLFASMRPVLWLGILINSLITSSVLNVQLPLALSVGASLCLISGFAFVLNDTLDKEIDKVNAARRRPVSVPVCLGYGAATVATITFLYLSNRGAMSFEMFLALVFLFILSALYSVIFSRMVFVKNLTAAVLATSPIWVFLVSPSINDNEVFISLSLIAVSISLFILAREIRFDQFDKKGDILCGRLTLPHYFSNQQLLRFEQALTVTGVALLVLVSLAFSPTFGTTIFAISAVLILGALLLIPLTFEDKERYYKVTRLAMFVSPAYILLVL